MKKPFDEILVKTMQETMQYLCENIQGCKIGYTQSDEITLLLIDYENLYSEAYFDNQIQKIVSVTASMATLAFNDVFSKEITNYYAESYNDIDEESRKRMRMLKSKRNKAMFDSRVFSMPQDEVNNCFLWRQLDASKNSISMVAQANFSHKELQNKNTSMMKDMLINDKGINWNDLPTTQKRGSCCTRQSVLLNKGTDRECNRNKWVIDNEIPRFNQETEYINKFVYVNQFVDVDE